MWSDPWGVLSEQQQHFLSLLASITLPQTPLFYIVCCSHYLLITHWWLKVFKVKISHAYISVSEFLFHFFEPICPLLTNLSLPCKMFDSNWLTGDFMLWKTCKNDGVYRLWQSFTPISLFMFQPPWPWAPPQRYFGYFLVRPPALCTATHWSTSLPTPEQLHTCTQGREVHSLFVPCDAGTVPCLWWYLCT